MQKTPKSGRIVIRIQPELYEQARKAAEKTHRSISDFGRVAIIREVERIKEEGK